MAIENDPSARMQFRTRGELAHPGQCIVCGSATCDEGYVDLGVFIDYEGTIYLCHTCVTQAAEIIGMFTPEQVESQQNLLRELDSENALMKEELNRVRPVINSIKHLGPMLTPASDPVDGFVNEESQSLPPVSEPEPGRSDDDSVKLIEGSDSRESESEEPVKVTKRSRTSGTTARNVTF